MFSTWSWLLFSGLIIAAITFDLSVSLKSDRASSAKKAGLMTFCWICLASVFAGVIYYQAGFEPSVLFITGYLVELSLSVDNIFVFILIFKKFKISSSAQHKILVIGILSAIVMRFLMISAGILLIHKFQWIFYIFGAFLIYSGVQILRDNGSDEHAGDSFMKFLKKILPFTDKTSGNKFIVKINGKRFMTPLVAVLFLIEQVDLVFALDSIPAILAITDDLFIVFTSNIFAILGLRSMYFFLSNAVEKFIYLKHALSIILCFIGCKMIASVQGYHIPIAVSLSVIIVSILGAIAFSLIKQRTKV